MNFEIPNEQVGSLPRPAVLQQAYADYDSGNITKPDLEKIQDDVCRDSITRMEATGQWCCTDGENRASSFATYPFTDTLNGTGLAEGLVANGQYFAIFDDGHHRQLPRLVHGPFRYKTYAADYLKLSLKYATKPMKQAVISPSMLYLLYPLKEEIEVYSRATFIEDLVNECEKDIRLCFEAGAIRVSIDFTEGRLALKNDPRNPWTSTNLLPTFINLNNRVLDRFSAAERVNIGVHTCPGGDCDSVHSKEVPYHKLLPSLFRLNAGYFLIQLSSEPPTTKPAIYQLISQHLRRSANGVKQIAFIGVTDPLSPRIETPEEVCDALLEAAKYIPVDQLGATDDCGFSPFSIDVKPKHEGPDEARNVAERKVRSRVEGARLAGVRLGLVKK